MSGRSELRRPRWREAAKAHAGGYFWLPCDVCGEHFGGHEKGGGWILLMPTTSRMTCPQCPGRWVQRGDRYIQVEVQLGADGELFVGEVWGSSDWPESVNQTITVRSVA